MNIIIRLSGMKQDAQTIRDTFFIQNGDGSLDFKSDFHTLQNQVRTLANIPNPVPPPDDVAFKIASSIAWARGVVDNLRAGTLSSKTNEELKLEGAITLGGIATGYANAINSDLPGAAVSVANNMVIFPVIDFVLPAVSQVKQLEKDAILSAENFVAPSITKGPGYVIGTVVSQVTQLAGAIVAFPKLISQLPSLLKIGVAAGNEFINGIKSFFTTSSEPVLSVVDTVPDLGGAGGGGNAPILSEPQINPNDGYVTVKATHPTTGQLMGSFIASPDGKLSGTVLNVNPVYGPDGNPLYDANGKMITEPMGGLGGKVSGRVIMDNVKAEIEKTMRVQNPNFEIKSFDATWTIETSAEIKVPLTTNLDAFNDNFKGTMLQQGYDVTNQSQMTNLSKDPIGREILKDAAIEAAKDTFTGNWAARDGNDMTNVSVKFLFNSNGSEWIPNPDGTYSYVGITFSK